MPACGSSPVSWTGTASSVASVTVVASRYQVASRASRARFGNRRASNCPSASMIVVTGSSSRITCTIGVDERAGPATEPEASPLVSSSDTGEKTRKTTTTTSGAGERAVSREWIADARA